MKTLLLSILIFLGVQHSAFSHTLTPHQVDSLFEAANLLIQEKAYAEANTALEVLMQHAEESADWPAFLEYGLQRGINLQKMGDYSASAVVFERLIGMAGSKVSAGNEHLAMLYHKLGVANHYLKEYPKASQYYRKALEMREKEPEKYRLDLIKGYYAIGYIYYEMGDYHSALKNLKWSIALQTAPPSKELYRAYRILSRTYREMGDYSQTKNYLALLQQYHAVQDKDKPLFLAGLSLDQANFFNEFEKGEETLIHARAALEKLKEAEPLEKAGLATKANALHNLGEGYRLLEQYKKALPAFQASLAINEDINGEIHSSTARANNNIGLTYLNMGQLDQAISYLERAIAIKKQLKNPAELSSSLNNLGDVWMARKQYQKAAENYHQAVCYGSPFCDSLDFRYLLSPEEVMGSGRQQTVLTLDSKARALHALYLAEKDTRYLNMSFATYRLVSELIDQLRTSYQTDRSKEFLIKKTKGIYEGAIALSLELYRLTGAREYYEQALTFSEKSKSIILLEAALRSNESLFTGIPLGLRQRELHFKSRLAIRERQLASARLAGELEEAGQLMEQLVKLNEGYQLLQDSILKEYPEYYNLLLSASTISLNAIQKKLLSRSQAMVEYFQGKEKLYVFVVKKREFFVEELPLDFPLAKWVRNMRDGIYGPHISSQLAAAPTKEEYQAQYAKYGHLLYQKLLSPLEEQLPRELILIPDGVLGYLPFEAMLTQPVLELGRFRQYNYVLQEHQLSYAYSATILFELKERADNSPSEELLAVAPSFNGLLANNSRGVLGPLFFNREEAARITQIFGGKAIEGPEAMKKDFLKLAPQYRVIHISSHAKASDIAPNQSSYIAFTQKEAILDEAQLLFLWELYNLQLEADMVVLSACETGLGQLLEGEGIISLARAFSYAGAKSVITTLWPVNDKSTAELMVQFYVQLEDGKSKRAALAAAKASLLSGANTADPYFWAGFIAIGDMAPLRPWGGKWLFWLAAVLVGLVLGGRAIQKMRV